MGVESTLRTIVCRINVRRLSIDVVWKLFPAVSDLQRTCIQRADVFGTRVLTASPGLLSAYLFGASVFSSRILNSVILGSIVVMPKLHDTDVL